MFINERQPNSQEHEDCLEWQRRKTRLLWLMRPSTQCIGKDIGASPYCLLEWGTLTGDRHDELAAMDLSTIAVALTPSWLVWILTVMPVWLYFSSFVLLLNTKLYVYYHNTSVSCVWVLLPYVSLQSNWVWKPSKLGQFISFSLWGLSSLLTLY